MLNDINKWLNSLPSKDIKIAEHLIKNRDFEGLKDLVDSAIIRTKKNLRSESPKQEYLDVDIEKLNTLKSYVDIYVMQLEIPEQTDDEEDDVNDE